MIETIVVVCFLIIAIYLYYTDKKTNGMPPDKRFEVDNEELQEFQHFLTEIIVGLQAPKFYVLTFFPWFFSIIPSYVMKNIILKEHFQKLGKYHEFFLSCIEEHKKEYDENNIRDMTDAFLTEMHLNEKGEASPRSKTFTEQELLYTVADLFAGGSETTSTTLRWILFYMANNQFIQKKVQDEIDNVLPRSRLPNLNDRVNLPYLDAVIHEVMRLKTLVPLGTFHYASKDTMIGKYRIPKGSTVLANINACHHDPRYWDRPKEFLPERFILADGSFNNQMENFLPFSTGRRVCIGESMAKMELYVFTGALLQNFSFKSADGQKINPDPDSSTFLFALPGPMKIIISERD